MTIAALIERGVTLAVAGEHGRDWYRDSGLSIHRYCQARGFDFERACDVVAILSPRVQVRVNVRLARSYLETGVATGAMIARQRALKEYEITGYFGGRKVNAFSRALQGDSGAVVVDTWMLRAFGETNKVSDARLNVVESLIRASASALDWTDCETQAAIWVGIRQESGLSDSYSPLRLED